MPTKPPGGPRKWGKTTDGPPPVIPFPTLLGAGVRRPPESPASRKAENTFAPTDIQDRFRQTARGCIALGDALLEGWCRAHFDKYDERVTVADFIAWEKIPSFKHWFFDAGVRRRSETELTILRAKATARVAEEIDNEDPKVALSAARIAIAITDKVDPARAPKAGRTDEDDNQAALADAIRRSLSTDGS